MNRLLLMLTVLLVSPAVAGDLGIYDELVPGVNAKVIQLNQRIFKTAFGSVEFQDNRLIFRFESTRDSKSLLKVRGLNGPVDPFQGYIEPGQVDSYNYFFEAGGLFFAIHYTSRSGERSTAYVGFADANTAMSFNKVFMAWWNKKLPSRQQMTDAP